jgi:hypothetical protein
MKERNMIVIKRSATQFSVIAPLKLVKVKEKAQPNFCQIHGTAAGTLYWSGKTMRCLECDKIPSYVREEQMNFDSFQNKLLYLVERMSE